MQYANCSCCCSSFRLRGLLTIFAAAFKSLLSGLDSRSGSGTDSGSGCGSGYVSTSCVSFVCLINLPGKRQFQILAAIGKQQPQAPAGCSSCNNGYSNSNSNGNGNGNNNISYGCNYSYSNSNSHDYDYGIRCEDKGNQLTVAIVSLGNSTKLQLSFPFPFPVAVTIPRCSCISKSAATLAGVQELSCFIATKVRCELGVDGTSSSCIKRPKCSAALAARRGASDWAQKRITLTFFIKETT